MRVEPAARRITVAVLSVVVCVSQRAVSFMVLFYEMGKTVADFWPRASCGYLGYRIERSQSNMRIATTASPVSGADLRERMSFLARQKEYTAAMQLFARWTRRWKLRREVERVVDVSRRKRERERSETSKQHIASSPLGYLVSSLSGRNKSTSPAPDVRGVQKMDNTARGAAVESSESPRAPRRRHSFVNEPAGEPPGADATATANATTLAAHRRLNASRIRNGGVAPNTLEPPKEAPPPVREEPVSPGCLPDESGCFGASSLPDTTSHDLEVDIFVVTGDAAREELSPELARTPLVEPHQGALVRAVDLTGGVPNGDENA